MTKYNKAEIMRNANRYAKMMSRSEALKTAWANAKLAKMPTQRDIYTAAFFAKYPNGTFTKKDRGYRFEVTFAPGGKVYTYIGGLVMIAQKLGLQIA